MTSSIGIDSRGTVIPSEVFQGKGTLNGSSVVLVHGSDGMTEPWATWIREYAAELAERDCTVIVPNYFAKTGTDPGLSVFMRLPTHLDAWVEAVSDVVAHAKTLPGISANRVGLLGFSLGGHICLRLRGTTCAVVAFFAPELRQLGGLGTVAAGAPAIEIHHGEADALVPFSEAQAIVATLKQEGIVAKVFAYEGAGHGFAGADPNNATARRSSKGRTLAFFEKQLQAESEAQYAR